MEVFQARVNLPTKKLGGNSRGHTKGKAGEVAAYRSHCASAYQRAHIPVLTVRPAKGERAVRVRIDLEYFLAPTLDGNGNRLDDNLFRPMDEDSARTGFKAGQDALQDVGLIPNDSATFVECGSTKIYRTPGEHGGRRGVIVTLTVESLPDPGAAAAQKSGVKGKTPAENSADLRAKFKQNKRGLRGR